MKYHKKLHLFELFSRNLQRWLPELDGQFMCPLCLRKFEKGESPFPNRISGAHIWPKALGGREETVTCSDCNSKMGSTIENHAANWARYINIVHGDLAGNIKISIETGDGGEVNAQLVNEFDEEREVMVKNIKVLGEHSHPEHLKQFREDMKRFSVGSEFTFHHRNKFSPREMRLTYLHMGYLLMFHYFGYEWVICPSSKVIREQLFRPKEKLIEPALIPIPTGNNFPDSDGHVELWFIYEPVEWIGYVAITPRLSHYGGTRMGIRLPAFTETYETPTLRSAQPRFFGPISLRHSSLDAEDDFRSYGALLAHDILKKYNPTLLVSMK